MQKQAGYEATLKLGRRLGEKFDAEASDRAHLSQILAECKQKWQAATQQSAERQRRLEDALLCSGQFRDALLALLEWLHKIEPTLADTASLAGDLDCVSALVEDNEQFRAELALKADQVSMVQQAAGDLLLRGNKAPADAEVSAELHRQLAELAEVWRRVETLSKQRTVRLEKAYLQVMVYIY